MKKSLILMFSLVLFFTSLMYIRSERPKLLQPAHKKASVSKSRNPAANFPPLSKVSQKASGASVTWTKPNSIGFLKRTASVEDRNLGNEKPVTQHRTSKIDVASVNKQSDKATADQVTGKDKPQNIDWNVVKNSLKENPASAPQREKPDWGTKLTESKQILSYPKPKPEISSSSSAVKQPETLASQKLSPTKEAKQPNTKTEKQKSPIVVPGMKRGEIVKKTNIVRTTKHEAIFNFAPLGEWFSGSKFTPTCSLRGRNVNSECCMKHQHERHFQFYDKKTRNEFSALKELMAKMEGKNVTIMGDSIQKNFFMALAELTNIGRYCKIKILNFSKILIA